MGLRLIPAHAGKTATSAGDVLPVSAHPRSRGENYPLRGSVTAAMGSSPLTRGKLPDARRMGDHTRLIPAHAGKTAAASAMVGRPSAHPRSRGENVIQIGLVAVSLGSSPLTRGKRRQLNPMRAASRLIPAHAGKTCVSISGDDAWEAHPRSRGENYQAHATALQAGGSSPLTRGKR